MKTAFSLLCIFVLATQVPAQVTKKFTTAVAYNDFIVDEQVKIGEAIKAFNTAFGNTEDTLQIHEARKAITKQADSSINQLKRLVPFSGDTALKKNAMSLFSFYSKTASNEYKQLVQIYYSKKTNEDISKELQALIKVITDKEALYDKNFQDAQKAFAAKHNIDLKANEFKLDQ
jgi:phospholipase/lecithinase/hemolysin